MSTKKQPNRKEVEEWNFSWEDFVIEVQNLYAHCVEHDHEVLFMMGVQIKDNNHYIR